MSGGQRGAEGRENVVVGAGSVGLTLAARLAEAGEPVRIVTRRPEAAREIAGRGLVAEDPASGATRTLRVPAVCGLQDTPSAPDARLWLAVRVGDVAPLAAELAGTRAPVIALQNDVGSDETLAAAGLAAIGGVWRETCTRVADHRVRFRGSGRVVLGLHPSGRSPEVDAAAAALRRAGIDTGVSERIAEDKWLKLCVNLMSAPNALVRAADHETEAFVRVKTGLLEEARDVLAAAGIATSSCDGRDRSLDQEIAFQKSALERGASARRIPLYNQVWSTLERGSPPEADAYHRRILELARAHGRPAPVNARVLAALEDALARRRGAGCLTAAELLA